MKVSEMTFEQYVEYKLRINAGSQAGIEAPSRQEIDKFCILHEITIDKGDSKKSLIEKILQKGITHYELAEYFNSYLGIHSAAFQEKFNVDHKTIKKMEKKNLLKVMYYSPVRMYGKYRDVPMYDANVYFGSQEEFEQLLSQL